jgi:hypothetical protein
MTLRTPLPSYSIAARYKSVVAIAQQQMLFTKPLPSESRCIAPYFTVVAWQLVYIPHYVCQATRANLNDALTNPSLQQYQYCSLTNN